MLVLDIPPSADNDPSAWLVAADALAAAASETGRRAAIVSSLPECLNDDVRDHIVAHGLTPLLGLAEGLVALRVAATVGRRCDEPHAAVQEPQATRMLDEASAKARLRSLGISVPDGAVSKATDVVAAADRIGYPVTLKTLGTAHKSETGAVKVGLDDSTAVSSALARMPAAEQYLVESTVTDVVAEVLVAVRRDPPVGWLVTLGYGGVTTEVWSDVTHLLAPVTADQVRAGLAKLRSAALLNGFRGRPLADVDALVGLVVRLAETVVGTAAVEVELNPVLVGRRGAVAVDALWIEEDRP